MAQSTADCGRGCGPRVCRAATAAVPVESGLVEELLLSSAARKIRMSMKVRLAVVRTSVDVGSLGLSLALSLLAVAEALEGSVSVSWEGCH